MQPVSGTRQRSGSAVRALISVAVLLASITATIVPAAAQDGPLSPIDGATGWDHAGDPPPGFMRIAS